MLKEDKRFKNNNMLSYNDSNSCRISTVDRFQGDEEDVIITSLVVDSESKTNFVKIRNRMIVLLSRARLGMYILGNISYFNNLSSEDDHWFKTLKSLQQPAESDSKENIKC